MSSTPDSESIAVPPSREDLQRVIDTLNESDVNLVHLQFSDIAGGGRTVTIPASLLPKVFRRGFRFDGSAMTGGMRQVEMDLFLSPDPGTLVVLPSLDGQPNRAQLYCWVTRRGGQPFAGDPRTILQQQLHKAAALGLDYRVGIELEFYLYRGESLASAIREGSDFSLGYFSDGAVATSAVRDEIVAVMHELGLGVHGSHHETGPGQQELDLRHLGGIRIADQLTSTRQLIRMIAQKHGLKVTFMAKPWDDAPGSGMHLFQRLLSLEDGSDLLGTDQGNAITPMAGHMIAGQIRHASAMSAILNTTVNSYKRLSDGHRAPAWATWAKVSEASLLRVPAVPAGTPTDIELRSPDAMANPYLAIAVSLGAAVSGIEQKLAPPEPFDENLVHYNEDEYARLGVDRLPQTLGQAIDNLGQDDTMRDILGHYIVDQLLTVKRAEWDEYRRHVSPWERAKYGEM
jgi:glutamine synthetase